MSESAELEPWQERVFKDIKSVYKPGEMTITMAARGSGKSQITAYHRLWKDIMEANTKVTDIVLSEGTVYGSRYLTAAPIGGNWYEMASWCFETFGDTRSIWSETKNFTPKPLQRWYINNRKFWFKEVKDRDWFVIRWNS